MSTRGTRIWRHGLISAGLVLTFVLLVVTLLSLALYTETGSRRVAQEVISRINALENLELRSGSIAGNLLSGLTLTDLVIEVPAATIAADVVRASWNPYSLLSGSFYLTELDIGTLSVTVQASETENGVAAASDSVALLRLEPLPVNLAIGKLAIGNVEIVMLENGPEQHGPDEGSPGQAFTISNLALAAELHGAELSIQDFHLEAFDAIVDLNLQATLQGNIPVLASVNWEYQGTLFADYDLAVGTAAITGDLTNLRIEHELKAPEAIHSSGHIVAPLAFATPTGNFSLEFVHDTESLHLPFAGISDYLFDNVELVTRLDGVETGANAVDNPVMELMLELQSGVSGEGLPESRLNATAANELRVSGNFGGDVALDWQMDAPELAQLLLNSTGSATGSGHIEGPLDNPAITAHLLLQNLQSAVAAVNTLELSLDGTREQLRGTLQAEDIMIALAGNEQRISRLSVQVDGSLAAHAVGATVESDLGNLALGVTGGIEDLAALIWEGALNTASLQSEFGNWQKQSGATALTLSRSTAQMDKTCWELDATSLCLSLEQTSTDDLQLAAALTNFPLSEFDADAITADPRISSELMPRLPEGLSLEGVVSAELVGTFYRNGGNPVDPNGNGLNNIDPDNIDPDNSSPPPRLNFSLNANNAVLSIASTEPVDAALVAELEALQDQRYQWNTLEVTGAWQNNNWTLSGNAALSQQNVDGTNSVSVPGFNGVVESALTIDAAGNLAGVITSSFAELGWVQAFLPELSEVSGSLTGDLDISGTLRTPLFSGELNLNEGSATLSRIGISLSEAQSRIAVQSSGEVQFDGTLDSRGGAAASGSSTNSPSANSTSTNSSDSGSLAFYGNITNLYDSSRNLQATLTGSNFLLADIADLTLQVSPQLTLVANNELIQLQGSLDVPLLDLTLLELPATAVDVSRDAVVIAYPADQPELAQSIASGQGMLFNIPVAAEINLTLGDAVAVSGFGIEATLDGDLSIQQRADGRNLTYGELSIVEGNYSIYGQTLTLRQGKLLFFGAIDNPALDIRAVREAEGVTVGVLMNGTLKNIRSQLFSTPVLPDNDIISLLVTGRPASELGQQDGAAVLGAMACLGLDRTEGLTNQIRNTLGLDALAVTSAGNIDSSVLTIGKYLTPDIFVRYGVGLFDRTSKIAIDYSLSERLILQAESGEYQSIDLTYTVEQ